MTGTVDWHINPDEPTVLDYNVEFKTANQVVTLLRPGSVPLVGPRPGHHRPELDAGPTVDAGGPYAVIEGGSVMVSATGSEPDGEALTYRWDLDGDGTLRDGRAVGDLLGGRPPGPGEPDHRGPGDRPDRTDRHRSGDGQRHLGLRLKSPILDLPAVNQAGPGKLTLKFSLGGNQGLDIFKPGYPASASYPCGTTPPSDAGEQALVHGANGFSYDKSGANTHSTGGSTVVEEHLPGVRPWSRGRHDPQPGVPLQVGPASHLRPARPPSRPCAEGPTVVRRRTSIVGC